MRFIIIAIVLFAGYSAYNEFFAKKKSEPTYSIPVEYEESVYQAKANIEAIRSGISRDSKRNTFSGKDPFPTYLTEGSDHLFNNVLITPINPSKNGWQQKSPHTYTYTYASNKMVEFSYSPENGEFICMSSYDVCQLFDPL